MDYVISKVGKIWKNSEEEKKQYIKWSYEKIFFSDKQFIKKSWENFYITFL